MASAVNIRTLQIIFLLMLGLSVFAATVASQGQQTDNQALVAASR